MFIRVLTNFKIKKQPTFGGFGSSSGFGGFKSSSTTTETPSFTKETTTSVPSFGSFAKATTSPFIAAAAAGNALSTPDSPTTSSASTDLDNGKDNEQHESDSECNNDTPAAFGESAKVKVPGVKQQTEGNICVCVCTFF